MKSSKKDIILDTATKLFELESYISVGVDKITLESDVAKMTFYKYFQSKDDLVAAVLEKRELKIKTSLEDILQRPIKASIKLEKIILWFKNWMFDQGYHGCMFMKSQEEFPSNEKFRKINLRYKDWLHRSINTILTEMRIDNASQKSMLIVVTLDGLIISANLGTLTENNFDFTIRNIIDNL